MGRIGRLLTSFRRDHGYVHLYHAMHPNRVKLDNRMSVPLYWWRDKPNFGDVLSPIIVSHFAQEAVHFSISSGKLLAIGSVLGWAAKENDIVWGSGLLWPGRLPKTLTVMAVRGPKTREVFLKQGIDCPAIYGDPGWLMPQI